MDLKELLGEELFTQVEAKLGNNKIAIVSDGNWIPRGKFDEINTEKNTYKEQVTTLNTELGKLKDQTEGNEGLQTQLQTLQTQIAEKDKAMADLKKVNTIKFEALKMQPRDINDILPHLKQETISITDEGITGLKEQLEALKTSKPYLFAEEQAQGTGGSKGAGPKGGTDPKVESLGDAFLEYYKK